MRNPLINHFALPTFYRRQHGTVDKQQRTATAIEAEAVRKTNFSVFLSMLGSTVAWFDCGLVRLWLGSTAAYLAAVLADGQAGRMVLLAL